MGPSYEEIKAVLNTPGSSLKSLENPLDKLSQGAWIQDPTVLKPIKYDVPMDSIYDRLSDGSYIKKFDNYLGATGNEDRLGRQQSTAEQWGHGLAKMGAKTINYALDATVGTIYGIGQAIDGGKFDKFWNNDFSNKLDDWNKSLDNGLANYYTDEQKSMSVIRKLGTANFWANDFAGGLAFVGGALLPEIALAALTGGATIAGSAAKIGFKSGLKSAMKIAGRELAEEAFDPTNYLQKSKGLFGKETFNAVEAAKSAKTLDGGLDLLKATNRANYLGTAGRVADTALFLTRTSAFEAGMEARHNFKESVETYTNKFADKNGRLPTADELEKFTKAAVSGANAVFGANMAILSVSNAAMFGKAFNIKGIQKVGQKLEGLENRILGIGTKTELVDGVLRTTVNQATKGQKLIGNAYKVLSKPAIEGLYEEGFQGVAGKTMQNYLENKYVNKNESYGYFSALGEAFKDQYTTNEGWTEMMVGMLIGGTAGAVTSPLSKVASKISGQEDTSPGFLGSIPGVGKNSRKAAQMAMQEKADAINKGVDTLRSMNRASSAKNFRDQLDSGNSAAMGFDEALLNREFIKSQDSLKTPKQILEDFTTIIEHTDFNDNGISDIIGEENVQAYKTKLVEDFKTSIDNHTRAAKTVEALNLGNRLKDATLGNQLELEDNIETMLYLGLDSKNSAARIGAEIDTLIGESGTYNAMQFFDSISADHADKIESLNRATKELATAKKLAEQYGLELTGLRQSKRTTAQSEARYNQISEKAALAAEQVLKLEAERDQLESVLKETVDPELLGKAGNDIASVIEKIESLDKYQDALRKAGRVQEANAIAYKVKQFKMYSDMSRESATFFTKMTDQNFFETKIGKDYKDAVIGKPYKMSKELFTLIEENDALVDRALSERGLVGNRTEIMQQLLEGNDQLSEREKYKIASLYRMVLTAQNLNRIKQEIQDDIVTYSAEETSGIEGDSIEVAESINIRQEDLGTLALLNEAIDKILSQVEFIRGNSKAAEQVEKLEKQLDELKQQKAELEARQTAQGNVTVAPQTDIGAKKAEIEKAVNNLPDNLLFITHITSEGNAINIFNGNLLMPAGVSSTTGIVSKDQLKKILFDLAEGKSPHRGYLDMFIGAIDRATLENTNGKSLQDKLENYLDENFTEDVAKTQLPSSLNVGYFTGGVLNTKYDAEATTEESTTTEVSKLQPGDVFYSFDPKTEKVEMLTVKEVINNIGSVERIITEEGKELVNPYKSEKASTWSVSLRQKREGEDLDPNGPKAIDLKPGDKFQYRYKQTGLLRTFTVKSTTATELGMRPQKNTKRVSVKEAGYVDHIRTEEGEIFRNQELFLGGDLSTWRVFAPVTTKAGAESRVAHIEVARKSELEDNKEVDNKDIVDEINAKYDAELARLEKENPQFKIEQDAIKESNQQQKDSNEQSSSSQYQGTNTGQQTTGQTEGSQRDTEEQSPNSGNSTIASQIQEIDQKIEEITSKIDSIKKNKFKVIESEDWKRLDELTKKSELSDAEQEELDTLKQEIDNWTLLTGVVVDGFRLSDLLVQRNTLENTPVEVVSEATELTVEEVLSGLDLGDSAKGANYNYSLGFYSVQAFRDRATGLVSVSGITADALFEEMGVNYAKVDDKSYKIVIDGNAYTVLVSEQKKNLQFTDDAIEAINTGTNVSIAPTNKDIPTGYSIMYKFPGGTTEGEVLQSDFPNSFDKPSSEDDVYAMQKDDEVFFEIDPNDKENKRLLAPYRTEEEPIDQDKIDTEIISLYEQKLASDTVLIGLEQQLAEAQAEKSLTTKTSDLSKINRRIESIGKKITKRQENLFKQSETDVVKKNKKAAKAAKGKKDAKALQKSLVIHVVDRNGNRLQVLKAKNDNKGVVSKDDALFEALRDLVGNNEELIAELAGIGNPIQLDLRGAKVEKVLLGHPNLNIVKNEDGSHSVVYKKITNTKNIVDIGFIEDGDYKLRGSKEGVNTYYIKKFLKNSKGRIPVIVFEKAGRKIAYPARVTEAELRDHKEFENIYNSDVLDSKKVVALNKYLAANGIDIKEQGQAFIIAGKSNLNSEFFNNKLAQLNNLKYFYNMDAWLDSKSDLSDILKTQVMVNINLSNPIHSPKLKLDFSGLPIEVKPNVKNNTSSNMTRLFGVSSSTKTAKAAKKNANDDLNEQC